MIVAVALLIVTVVVVTMTHSPASELEDCKTFTGTATRATWKSCPSRAVREIACEPTFGMVPVQVPGFDSLTCRCLRDGEQTWFFDAKTAPPLASREDAERVAAASCKMW